MRDDWSNGWNCLAPKTFTIDLTMPVPNGHRKMRPAANAVELNSDPSRPGIVVRAIKVRPGK